MVWLCLFLNISGKQNSCVRVLKLELEKNYMSSWLLRTSRINIQATFQVGRQGCECGISKPSIMESRASSLLFWSHRCFWWDQKRLWSVVSSCLPEVNIKAEWVSSSSTEVLSGVCGQEQWLACSVDRIRTEPHHWFCLKRMQDLVVCPVCIILGPSLSGPAALCSLVSPSSLTHSCFSKTE